MKLWTITFIEPDGRQSVTYGRAPTLGKAVSDLRAFYAPEVIVIVSVHERLEAE